ncbi:MAG: hypothetical protein ACSLFM_13690 [Tepidiformaceae bacterium]
MIDWFGARSGDVIVTVDGDRAEVVLPSEDQRWILVKYLPGGDPVFDGTTDLVYVDEVVEIWAQPSN